MKLRIPPAAVLAVLGAVLAAFAFQWGRASAAGESGRRQTAVVEAVAHAAPAVVSVEAVLRGGRTRGSGSGVILHPRGFVITNSHVIRGGSRITVKPFQSKTRYPARVIVDDPNGDLALLQIVGGRSWPHISLSPSRQVLLGETAIAIGNPRGLGDSITVGVVSAKGRQAKQRNGATIRNLIQTDAPINSGNSGGPLLNLDGELIGINASMLPSAEGIAFAIPADAVELLLRRALGTRPPSNPLPEAAPPVVASVPGPRVGPAERVRVPSGRRTLPAPRVGPAPVVVEAPPSDTVPMRPTDVGLLIEDDGCRLLIRRVTPGSPAAAAGLMPGDLLLEVDGFAVESVNEVRLAFQGAKRGRVYDLHIRRGSRPMARSLVIP